MAVNLISAAGFNTFTLQHSLFLLAFFWQVGLVCQSPLCFLQKATFPGHTEYLPIWYCVTLGLVLAKVLIESLAGFKNVYYVSQSDVITMKSKLVWKQKYLLYNFKIHFPLALSYQYFSYSISSQEKQAVERNQTDIRNISLMSSACF